MLRANAYALLWNRGLGRWIASPANSADAKIRRYRDLLLGEALRNVRQVQNVRSAAKSGDFSFRWFQTDLSVRGVSGILCDSGRLIN